MACWWVSWELCGLLKHFWNSWETLGGLLGVRGPPGALLEAPGGFFWASNSARYSYFILGCSHTGWPLLDRPGRALGSLGSPLRLPGGVKITPWGCKITPWRCKITP